MQAESGQSVRNLKPHSLHVCLPRGSDQNHLHSPLSVWLIFTPPFGKTKEEPGNMYRGNQFELDLLNRSKLL